MGIYCTARSRTGLSPCWLPPGASGRAVEDDEGEDGQNGQNGRREKGATEWATARQRKRDARAHSLTQELFYRANVVTMKSGWIFNIHRERYFRVAALDMNRFPPRDPY